MRPSWQAPLLVCVLATYTAQQALAPVLAPLARRLDLPEVAVGSIVALAAGTFAVASLGWAVLLPRWGHRRILLLGTGIGTLALVAFAVVAQLATTQHLTSQQGLIGMLITRGLGFGAAIAAVPVAVSSRLAARTSGGHQRVSALGRVGAMQSLAVALGPALGGLFGGLGLLGPIWAAPALVAAVLIAACAVRAGSSPPGSDGRVAGDRPRVALRAWDTRLWPWLLVSFLVLWMLGLVLVVLAFLIQDRLDVNDETTLQLTGLVSMVSGAVLVTLQAVVVPRLHWAASRLLLAGLPVALTGLICLSAATSLLELIASVVVFSIGTGLATPGHVAAPTLVVDDEEQPAVAGLINATAGVSFVVGPLVGTSLYTWKPTAPVLTAAACCVAALLMVFWRGRRSDQFKGRSS